MPNEPTYKLYNFILHYYPIHGVDSVDSVEEARKSEGSHILWHAVTKTTGYYVMDGHHILARQG